MEQVQEETPNQVTSGFIQEDVEFTQCQPDSIDPTTSRPFP